MIISITRAAPKPTASESFEIGCEDECISDRIVRELSKLGVVERYGSSLVTLTTLHSEFQVSAAVQRVAQLKGKF